MIQCPRHTFPTLSIAASTKIDVHTPEFHDAIVHRLQRFARTAREVCVCSQYDFPVKIPDTLSVVLPGWCPITFQDDSLYELIVRPAKVILKGDYVVYLYMDKDNHCGWIRGMDLNADKGTGHMYFSGAGSDLSIYCAYLFQTLNFSNCYGSPRPYFFVPILQKPSEYLRIFVRHDHLFAQRRMQKAFSIAKMSWMTAVIRALVKRKKM